MSYKSSSCIKTSTRIQLSYWACKRLLFQSDMTWYLSILLHRRYSFSSRRWPPILFPCHLFAAKSVDMPSITRCVNNCEAQLAKEWRLHVYPVFCLELANFCFCLLVNRIDKNLRGSIQESRAQFITAELQINRQVIVEPRSRRPRQLLQRRCCVQPTSKMQTWLKVNLYLVSVWNWTT